MTVSKIKEYIDKKLKQSKEVRVVYDKHLPLIEALENIKYWLNELEPNKQIMWERDMAIKQLNELDYDLGEEVTTCTRCKFGSIVTDGAGIEHQDCDIGKKALSPVCRNKCDYFELNENKE